MATSELYSTVVTDQDGIVLEGLVSVRVVLDTNSAFICPDATTCETMGITIQYSK